jgi:hypothetical protein
MKPTHKILLGFLILAGLQFGLSSCLTDAYVGTGVYYGPQPDPWFRDDPWMDGRPWYRGDRQPTGGGNIDIYIHPPRPRR